MRLLSFLPVALLFIIAHLAAANPAPNPLAEPLPIDDLIALSKRQQPAAFCPYENDCTCSQGAVGVYCYGCDEVRSAGRGTGDYRDWVFQCGGNPGTCCSYGRATDCFDGAKGRCGA